MATETLESLLKALVGIDSTSSKSNAPMVEALESRLAEIGFTCRRHAYRDAAGLEKINLLAQRGEGTPELVLVGHTDCVPFDPSWTEALALTEKDGKLFGRGACDTKGFIACALEAARKTSTLSLRKPLGLIFTADEEVGCVGAKALVDAERGRARHAIVGEPTSLTPVRANKGYCLAEVEVLGREGHSAYPESGASAIFGAGRFLHALEAWAEGPLRLEGDDAFSPPYTSVNVGVISGGKAKNILPGACRFTVEWRPIPGQPVEKVSARLEEIAQAVSRETAGLSVRVEVPRADRGFDTPADAEVVAFLARESGRAAETVAFGTEAPQLTALGARAVVFGPGDIRVAHQTGEYVPRAELTRCAEILESAIRFFCA